MRSKPGWTRRFIRLRSDAEDGDWFVPPELRQLIVDDAATRGTSILDVVATILIDRYDVTVDVNGVRRSNPRETDGRLLNVDLPDVLWQEITRHANARRKDRAWSAQDEVRAALCAHYGLGYRQPRRGRRPRAAAA